MSIDRERDPLPRALPGSTVLQIVPSLGENPGAREVLGIAGALVRAGARAIVASPDGPLVPELLSFGGEWIHFASDTAHPWRLRKSRRGLDEVTRSERIDVIHALGVGGVKLAAGIAQRIRASLVFGCGDEAIAHGRDRGYSRALLRGDRCIAHSAYLSEQIIATHGVARDRMIAIYRPIEIARFNPAAVSVERVMVLRHAWKAKRGERVALVPGGIHPAKGQLVLIEAVRMLVSGGLRHVLFVLAGDQKRDPDYAAAVRHSANAHGVGDVIRQVGICPDMPAAYAAADFVVLPATVPPTFSRTVAEALAMGRPVIASELGALPEFVLAPPRAPDSARTGWLAAPNDSIGLARALATAEALELPALRDLGIRARQLAKELFAPAGVAAATLAVYAALLKGSP